MFHSLCSGARGRDITNTIIQYVKFSERGKFDQKKKRKKEFHVMRTKFQNKKGQGGTKTNGKVNIFNYISEFTLLIDIKCTNKVWPLHPNIL
jgi:hypothetical protein